MQPLVPSTTSLAARSASRLNAENDASRSSALFHNSDRDKIARGDFRVGEPACGSGVMVLAFRGVVARDMGREAASRLLITAADIDPICVSMARIQTLLTDDCFMRDFLVLCADEIGRDVRATP